MLSYNFISLINSPTKFNSNIILTRFSLIDHIWTKFCPNQVQSGVICDAIYDHFQIFVSFSVSLFIENSFTSFRIYNEANIENFLKSFNSLDFTGVFNTPDADLQYSAFHNFLENTFKEKFPIKREKIKPLRNCYWITTDLKYCFKKI